MKCSEFSGLVPSFLNDSLDDTSLREFLEHYDSCQGCREELEIQFLIEKVFNEMAVTDGINLQKDLPEYIGRERKLLKYRSRLTSAAVLMELTAVIALVLTAILYFS